MSKNRTLYYKGISRGTYLIDISLEVSNKHINKHISRQSNKQREYLPISAQADFVSVSEQKNKKSKQKGPQIDNYINFA